MTFQQSQINLHSLTHITYREVRLANSLKLKGTIRKRELREDRERIESALSRLIPSHRDGLARSCGHVRGVMRREILLHPAVTRALFYCAVTVEFSFVFLLPE